MSLVLTLVPVDFEVAKFTPGGGFTCGHFCKHNLSTGSCAQLLLQIRQQTVAIGCSCIHTSLSKPCGCYVLHIASKLKGNCSLSVNKRYLCFGFLKTIRINIIRNSVCDLDVSERRKGSLKQCDNNMFNNSIFLFLHCLQSFTL